MWKSTLSYVIIFSIVSICKKERKYVIMKRKLNIDEIAFIAMILGVSVVTLGIKLYSKTMFKGHMVYEMSSESSKKDNILIPVNATTSLDVTKLESNEASETESTRQYEIVADIEKIVVPYDDKEDALGYRKPEAEPETEVKVTEKPTVSSIQSTEKDTQKRTFKAEVPLYDNDGNIIYQAKKTDDSSDVNISDIVTPKNKVRVVIEGNTSNTYLDGYILETKTVGLRNTKVITKLVVTDDTKDSDGSDSNGTDVTGSSASQNVTKTSDGNDSGTESADKTEASSDKNTENTASSKESTSTASDTATGTYGKDTGAQTGEETQSFETMANEIVTKESQYSGIQESEQGEYVIYTLSAVTKTVTVDGWYTENGDKYYYYNENNYATGYMDIGGFKYYFNKVGKLCSKVGIDVSVYQGNIDWAKVAASGVEFAIIRACVRGYQYAKLSKDSNFDANVKGALANGLKVGAYVFSQATTEAEAIEEASLIITMCKNYNITGPLVIDVEEVNSSIARQNKISKETRTNIIKIFEQMVRDAGYTPMLYTGESWLSTSIDSERLDTMDFWIAKWSTNLPKCRYNIWQYSATGRVDGITGDVDLDIWITE